MPPLAAGRPGSRCGRSAGSPVRAGSRSRRDRPRDLTKGRRAEPGGRRDRSGAVRRRRSRAPTRRWRAPARRSAPREGILPFAQHDRGPRSAGDLHRPVVRTRVVDHDLVDGIPDGLQAGGQHLFLVLHDQAGGDQNGRAQRVWPPLVLEADLILELGRLPVDVIGVERGVAAVVDERAVRNEQPEVALAQSSAQIVVLEAADLEALVEAAQGLEGGRAHGKTKSDQPPRLRGLSPVAGLPGFGEFGEGSGRR